MLTRHEILNFYIDCAVDVFNGDKETCMKRYYAELYDCEFPCDENTEMTEIQWKNLVNVCANIVAHQNQFDMRWYHNADGGSCGTTHCIAGWAVVLEDGDVNMTTTSFSYEQLSQIAEKYGYDEEDMIDSSACIASAALSPLIEPFFYLISGFHPSFTVMDKFILPVLEIARNESQEMAQLIDSILRPVAQV